MDKTVRLWDVAKGKLIDTYPCLEAVKNCSFSPTDWILATADPKGNVYILLRHPLMNRPLRIEKGKIKP